MLRNTQSYILIQPSISYRIIVYPYPLSSYIKVMRETPWGKSAQIVIRESRISKKTSMLCGYIARVTQVDV